MNLPEGYTERPASLDEIDEYVGLFEAWDLADTGRIDPVREHLLDGLTSSAVDIGLDTRAVFDVDGSVVALAQVEAVNPGSALELFALVHPRHQGRGIGTACLEWMQRRAGDRVPAGATPSLFVAVSGTDVAGRAIVEAHGYRETRTFLHMEVTIDRVAGEALPPPGLSIGPIRPGGEELEVYRTVEDGFAGSFGWHEQSFEDFRHDVFEAATFDPELLLVAREHDRVAGVLHGIATEREGHVSIVVVREDARGRGIGEALLRRSFEAFTRRGLERVWLNVDSDNEAGAVRLYERVGMRPRRRWVVFERRLDGG